MGTEQRQEDTRTTEQATSPQFLDAVEPEGVSAWEQVDVGRYMPRRFKGSCKGRALG